MSDAAAPPAATPPEAEAWPRDPAHVQQRIRAAQQRARGAKLITGDRRYVHRELDVVCEMLDDALLGYNQFVEAAKERRAREAADVLEAAKGVPADLRQVGDIQIERRGRQTVRTVTFSRPPRMGEFRAWLEACSWLGYHPAGYSGSYSVAGDTGIYTHFNTSD